MSLFISPLRYRASTLLGPIASSSSNRSYATRQSIRRPPPQKMRVAKVPMLEEGASEAEVNELRLRAQKDQLRMVEAEAKRGNRRAVDYQAVSVPLLALHIPQRVLPYVLSGRLPTAGRIWVRETLEKLKDALHFWMAAQHPILPGMKKKPRLWHVFDIFGVRSISPRRPLAGLRQKALETYVRMNQLEAQGAIHELTTLTSDPLRSQIRARILQRSQSLANSSAEWKFHGEVEPTRCMSFRMLPSIGVMDLGEAEAGVQQVLMRFRTRQSLVVRDARGRIIGGNHDAPRVVTDYIVFEHQNWSSRGVEGWKVKAQMWDVPPSEAKK